MRVWVTGCLLLAGCAPDVHVVAPLDAIRTHVIDAGTVLRGGQGATRFSLASEHDWTLEGVEAEGTPTRFVPWLTTVGPPFVVLAPEPVVVGVTPATFEVLLRPEPVDRATVFETTLLLKFANAQRETTTLDLTLRGKAMPFTCGLEPLRVGRVAVGDSLGATLTLENRGDVAVRTVIGRGVTSADFTWSPAEGSLGPAETLDVVFTFTPTRAGDAGVELDVVRTEACGPERLTVSGQGLAPVTAPAVVTLARPASLGGSVRSVVPLENWLLAPVTVERCEVRNRSGSSDLVVVTPSALPAARRASAGLVPGRVDLPIVFTWTSSSVDPFSVTCALSQPSLPPLVFEVRVEG